MTTILSLNQTTPTDNNKDRSTTTTTILNHQNDDFLIQNELKEEAFSSSSTSSLPSTNSRRPSAIGLFFKKKFQTTKQLFSSIKKNKNDTSTTIIDLRGEENHNKTLTLNSESTNRKEATFTSSLNDDDTLSLTSSTYSSTESLNANNKTLTKCKICFNRYCDSECDQCIENEESFNRIFRLESCKCKFCIDCLNKYIRQCIENCSLLPIHCPDLKCISQGFISEEEVKFLLFRNASNQFVVSETRINETNPTDDNLHRASSTNNAANVYRKYLNICENIEILRNPNKAHCPRPECQNVCSITYATNSNPKSPNIVQVTCDKCKYEFCSRCFKKWTLLNASPTLNEPDCNNNNIESIAVTQNNCASMCKCMYKLGLPKQLSMDQDCEKQKLIESTSSLSNFKDIKRCPKCSIPIERAEGCAQIMCKFCRHTFCFYCLESLENDFMLKHYTKNGPCKGKLGHSRISLFFHRISVVGIFAGTVILMIILSPFILLTLPCLICSDKCRKTCYKFSTKFN